MDDETQTLADIEAIVQCWRVRILSPQQALLDIRAQLDIHEEIVVERAEKTKTV